MGKGWWAHALVITIIASLVAVHHASLKQKKPTKVRGFIATEFVTILLVPMDSKPNFNWFGQMKWMLPVHTSWPCHFSEEVSTYHHFQHVFLPSGRFWKVSQFAVLYQGPTTLWIFRFASGRCSAVWVQGASSVCWKCSKKSSTELNASCKANVFLQPDYSSLEFQIFFCFQRLIFFDISHSTHITIKPSSPSNHPVLYATITEMSFVEQFQALYLAPNVLRCHCRRRRRRGCCRRFKKRLFSLMGFFRDSFLIHLLLIHWNQTTKQYVFFFFCLL